MIRLVLCLVGLIGLMSAAGPSVAADILGDTKVPFSADRTVMWKGKTYVGKIYAVPGKQRHEQEINGLHPYAILRADLEKGYLVLPELHIYTEFPFPLALMNQADSGKMGKHHPEMLSGVKTDAYRIERSTEDGGKVDGKGWITPDGIVLKLDGDYTPVGKSPEPASLELSNIRQAEQDPGLFELPRGYTMLPPEAVQSLFNFRIAKPPKN